MRQRLRSSTCGVEVLATRTAGPENRRGLELPLLVRGFHRAFMESLLLGLIQGVSYMAMDQNPVLSRPPPVTSLCRGRLLQTLCRGFLAAMNKHITSSALFLRICCGGVCRRTPSSLTNLCREIATQACYKPNIFFYSLPYEPWSKHLTKSLLVARERGPYIIPILLPVINIFKHSSANYAPPT